MERSELEVSKRELLGKKVKQLRRRGIIPANVYGHNVPSMALQVDARLLANVLHHAGTRRLINLRLAGIGQPRPVLIHHIHRRPRTGEVLHVDFYQVSMGEKLRLHVPVVAVGESPAVRDAGGILVRNIDAIEVEALPGDLPPTIEVDVSGLKEIGDTITVKELKPPKGVTILAHPDDPVMTIAPPMVEEEELARREVEVAEEGARERKPAEGE